ncbi:ImpA family type VI secretion system protein [Paracoccus pacificus]|uniref:ImpA family type VI secretion system protein n=1 Tax=Paracoccus pacificus TaxID=1463598 RepID=A0ABW4R772_9RHOB
MALEWLLEPVSGERPCGPDLEREDVPEFVDYYYEAESRLPERYFVPAVQGTDGEGSEEQVFDPRSVNLRQEWAEIEPLLRQSRDLRLLTLLARFQILAGRLGDFADTLDATAGLMQKWLVEVHPVITHSATDRRNALDELGNQTTVVMPLLHLPLTNAREVTLRRYLAAQNAVSRRATEQDADTGQLLSALRNGANDAEITRLHTDLNRVAGALDRIVRLSGQHPTNPFAPEVGDTVRAIADMQALIAQARPALRPWNRDDAEVAANAAERAEQPAAQAGPTPAQGEGSGIPAPAVQPSAPAPSARVAAITDRAQARVTLEECERWLVRHDPSSPVILLLTQARLLFGRPLTEALESLLPADAPRAVISFASETGFSLNMDRLRSLSQAALGGFDAETGAGSDRPPEPPTIAGHRDVAEHLRAIEDFYRRAEPASPIPILLARGREMMDKGFDMIVTELIPRAEPKA